MLSWRLQRLLKALPLVSNIGVAHFLIIGIVMPSVRSLTSCGDNVQGRLSAALAVAEANADRAEQIEREAASAQLQFAEVESCAATPLVI